MNCLVVGHSHLWVVTIVFYTCILIPLRQLKRAFVSMFGLMVLFSCKGISKETEFPEFPSLPVARFEDLGSHACVGGDGERETEEICSICLVEFEGEDAVSKLGRCGHVFHVKCIEQWLDRNQFSCPLCRSFLFSQHHVHTKK